MALLLNIDTSLEKAVVILSSNETILDERVSVNHKDHAAFLHQAIKSVFEKTGYSFRDIDAIALVNGPGSYTGLRVGMAAVKGIAYAVQKPVISINSLELMAMGFIREMKEIPENALFCPMIDARRMEVYMAVYSKLVDEIIAPKTLILTPDSLEKISGKNIIHVFGSGAEKWKKMIAGTPNPIFTINIDYQKYLPVMAAERFEKSQFESLFYSDCQYLKDVYITPQKTGH